MLIIHPFLHKIELQIILHLQHLQCHVDITQEIVAIFLIDGLGTRIAENEWLNGLILVVFLMNIHPFMSNPKAPGPAEPPNLQQTILPKTELNLEFKSTVRHILLKTKVGKISYLLYRSYLQLCPCWEDSRGNSTCKQFQSFRSGRKFRLVSLFNPISYFQYNDDN